MNVPAKPSMNGKIVGTIAISAIIFGGFGYYLGSMYETDSAATTTYASPSAVAVASPLASASALTTPATSTANWKSYESADLKLSFKYPVEYGDVAIKKDDFTASKSAAAKGKEIVLTFSKNSKLSAGAVSKDFEASRGNALYEITSFAYSDGVCTTSQKADIECESLPSDTGVSTYLGLAPNGEGADINLAGFIPLSGSDYVALTFRGKETDPANKAILTDILSTVKSTN